MKRIYQFIVRMEKSLSNAFQHILFGLSIGLFFILLTFTTTLIVSNPDIPWNLFAKNQYNNFINHYSLTVGLFLTWLAITTLFFTVRRIVQTDKQLHLMEQQYQRSSIPVIDIVGREINIELTETNIIPDKPILLDIFTPEFEYPVIELINVGFHSAKEVKAIFLYDIDQIKEAFSIIDTTNLDLKIKDHTLELQYGNGKLYLTSNLLSELKPQTYSYLLPIDKGGKIFIRVPHSYMVLVTFWLDYSFAQRNSKSNVYNFPRLDLHIEYLDMFNKVHQVCYHLLFTHNELNDEYLPIFSKENYKINANTITPFILEESKNTAFG